MLKGWQLHLPVAPPPELNAPIDNEWTFRNAANPAGNFRIRHSPVFNQQINDCHINLVGFIHILEVNIPISTNLKHILRSNSRDVKEVPSFSAA
jgi:hypothetical protein